MVLPTSKALLGSLDLCGLAFGAWLLALVVRGEEVVPFAVEVLGGGRV
jgi:hypothetical protein